MIKEINDLMNENEMLKAQVNSDSSEAGPKVINQMNYLVNLLA